MPAIFDISPIVSPRTAVWPGDQAFERSVALNCDTGDSITLSSIKTTVHIGAHTDAPNHYVSGGQSIHERPLDIYVGPCQVISVDIGRNERIHPAHIKTPVKTERIIFRTETFPDPERFNTDFAALSGPLIHWLSKRGVRLVGIDTPSIDLCDDKLLESHSAVAEHDMAILEGVVLDCVNDGSFTLVALPLRLEGADASPVRAILLDDQ